jgi:hypothetical protein
LVQFTNEGWVFFSNGIALVGGSLLFYLVLRPTFRADDVLRVHLGGDASASQSAGPGVDGTSDHHGGVVEQPERRRSIAAGIGSDPAAAYVTVEGSADGCMLGATLAAATDVDCDAKAVALVPAAAGGAAFSTSGPAVDGGGVGVGATGWERLDDAGAGAGAGAHGDHARHVGDRIVEHVRVAADDVLGSETPVIVAGAAAAEAPLVPRDECGDVADVTAGTMVVLVGSTAAPLPSVPRTRVGVGRMLMMPEAVILLILAGMSNFTMSTVFGNYSESRCECSARLWPAMCHALWRRADSWSRQACG